MLSFSGQQQRYSIYTNQTNATTNGTALAYGTEYMNDSQRDILGTNDWPFLETVDKTQVTVGSQQFYSLPPDLDKLIDVTITVGTVLWKPRETTSTDHWHKINYAQNVTSNIPQWFYIQGRTLGFWPMPSSSGNTITYTYKKRVIDLSLPDYTTGTIVTATSGSAVIVGAGTSWNQSMAGSYIQIASGQSNNKGDNQWYQISSLATVNGTSLTLAEYYKGTSVVAGTATYIIGQMPSLPENYHIMPVYWAAAAYWRLNGNNIAKANEYKGLFEEKLVAFKKDFGTKSANPQLDQGVMERPTINPNLTVTLN